MDTLSTKTGFIAVHVGAGYHSPSKSEEYKKACQHACQQTMKLIKEGNTAVDAVMNAIAILEDYPCTNAGIGSCLTMDGTVECDASIMDATTLGYGAVGAIKGIKNPIKVAHCLLTEENKGLLSLGRVPPCFLTGDGAYTWAKEHGIEEIHPDKMITENALSSFKKYRQKLLTCTKRDCASTGNVHKKRKTDMVCIDNELLDTVGAISIDCHGNISSAVSSGGISLKQPGRVGQAAVYGCGCWAMKLSTTSVASSTTGCGEHLLKTMLARKCVESALGSECLDQAIRKVFQCDFLDSPFLTNVHRKHGGALVLRYEHNKAELISAHTTDSMCIGYMSSSDSKPKTRISRLPETGIAGQSLAIEGLISSVG